VAVGSGISARLRSVRSVVEDTDVDGPETEDGEESRTRADTSAADAAEDESASDIASDGR
jgi:hypothetical protein